MRIVLVMLGLMVTAIASAQSVTPLVTEAGKSHAKGEFTVRNDQLVPTVVTIEPRMLSFAPNGEMQLSEIPSTAVVLLSEISARVGPRQQHSFQFEIRCPQNCAVAFYAAFISAKPINLVGRQLQLVLHIPTSVYVCTDKAKDCRKRMRKQWGLKK